MRNKLVLGILAVLLVFGMSVLACRSAPPQSDLPEFVREARRNAPPDVLIGIGSASMPTQSHSRSIAESRARGEIARAMDTMVQQMIRDYTAGSEVDYSAVLSFQEDISVQLSQARLQGAVIVDEDWIGGTYFVVVHFSKNNVAREIGQAQAAAALRVPAMASFDAQVRMDEAFNRAAAVQPQVADR